MRKTTVALLALIMCGCGMFRRSVVAGVTGYSKVCVDGVSYLQFPSGVTVQYDTMGHVVSCR